MPAKYPQTEYEYRKHRQLFGEVGLADAHKFVLPWSRGGMTVGQWEIILALARRASRGPDPVPTFLESLETGNRNTTRGLVNRGWSRAEVQDAGLAWQRDVRMLWRRDPREPWSDALRGMAESLIQVADDDRHGFFRQLLEELTPDQVARLRQVWEQLQRFPGLHSCTFAEFEADFAWELVPENEIVLWEDVAARLAGIEDADRAKEVFRRWVEEFAANPAESAAGGE
jgi:hypothetical protein